MNQETTPASSPRGEEGGQVGKVIHYFDRAMVAVVRLTGDISVGDMVKITRGEEDASQKIESMEVNHEKVQTGKAGDEVAIKLDKESHEGAVVYKTNE